MTVVGVAVNVASQIGERRVLGAAASFTSLTLRFCAAQMGQFGNDDACVSPPQWSILKPRGLLDVDYFGPKIAQNGCVI
jgi:hypothetical protein